MIENKSILKCGKCTKTYKTEGGLQRHIQNKHETLNKTVKESPDIDQSVLVNLTKESQKELGEDKCYPGEQINKIKNFQFDISEDLLIEVRKLRADLNKTNEKFYSSNYSKNHQLISKV